MLLRSNLLWINLKKTYWFTNWWVYLLIYRILCMCNIEKEHLILIEVWSLFCLVVLLLHYHPFFFLNIDSNSNIFRIIISLLQLRRCLFINCAIVRHHLYLLQFSFEIITHKIIVKNQLVFYITKGPYNRLKQIKEEMLKLNYRTDETHCLNLYFYPVKIAFLIFLYLFVKIFHQ